MEVHEEANDRLDGEIDLLHFIQTSRILKFMTSYSLRRNQRQLVQYFKLYHLDEDSLKLNLTKPPQSTHEMLHNFDPMINTKDHRILFEILNRKINRMDSQFENDDETAAHKTRRLGTMAKLKRVFVGNSEASVSSDDEEIFH